MQKRHQPNGHKARKPTDADRFIGQQVRQARRALRLTQDSLAGLLGITFQQIQKYEAGQSRLSAGRLRDIAIALNQPIDFFYEPFEVDAQENDESQRKLKIRDLQRDAKRLIDVLADLDDLTAAVHLLAALELRQTANG